MYCLPVVGLMFAFPKVYSKVTSALEIPKSVETTIGKVPVIWLPRVTVREVVVAPVTVAAAPPIVTALSPAVAEKADPVMTTEAPA